MSPCPAPGGVQPLGMDLRVGRAGVSAAPAGMQRRDVAIWAARGHAGLLPALVSQGQGWAHTQPGHCRNGCGSRGGAEPLGNPFSCPASCPAVTLPCHGAVKGASSGSEEWLPALRPEPRGLSWRQLPRLLMIDTNDGLHGLGREIIHPGRLRESHRLGEWRSGRRGRAVAPVSVSVCLCVRVRRCHGAWTWHQEPGHGTPSLVVAHRARPWHNEPGHGTREPLSVAGATASSRCPEGGDRQGWQEQHARPGTVGTWV